MNVPYGFGLSSGSFLSPDPDPLEARPLLFLRGMDRDLVLQQTDRSG